MRCPGLRQPCIVNSGSKRFSGPLWTSFGGPRSYAFFEWRWYGFSARSRMRPALPRCTEDSILSSQRGDDMEQIGNIKVLFIAGFGPIVREAAISRKHYNQVLGIAFKEESGSYLHTEALGGAESFALWPLEQAAQSCFGKDSWPDELPAPQAWRASRDRRQAFSHQRLH